MQNHRLIDMVNLSPNLIVKRLTNQSDAIIQVFHEPDYRNLEAGRGKVVYPKLRVRRQTRRPKSSPLRSIKRSPTTVKRSTRSPSMKCRSADF